MTRAMSLCLTIDSLLAPGDVVHKFVDKRLWFSADYEQWNNANAVLIWSNSNNALSCGYLGDLEEMEDKYKKARSELDLLEEEMSSMS